MHYEHRPTWPHDPKLEDKRLLGDGYVLILSDVETYRSSSLALLIP